MHLVGVVFLRRDIRELQPALDHDAGVQTISSGRSSWPMVVSVSIARHVVGDAELVNWALQAAAAILCFTLCTVPVPTPNFLAMRIMPISPFCKALAMRLVI